jgi:transcriptional regulator with XRE-family HTH domain
MSSLGNRIRALRKTRKLNLAQLASESGISTSYLSQLERGEKEGVSADILFRLANSLGTTMGALLREERPERECSPVEELPGPLVELYNKRGPRLGMTESDLSMLSGIRYRGHQPRTMEDWEFLYLSIKRTIPGGES